VSGTPSFVLLQILHLTNGWTDRIFIARPRLHSTHRCKNVSAAFIGIARIFIAGYTSRHSQCWKWEKEVPGCHFSLSIVVSLLSLGVHPLTTP